MVAEPIKLGDGYQIIRVDERTPGGTTPTFNDNRVREAMLMERQQKSAKRIYRTCATKRSLKSPRLTRPASSRS